MKLRSLFFVGVLLILIVSALPRVINYQGKLTNTDGTGVNGALPMVFRLFTSEEGGYPIWEETDTVSVTNGLFSVFLGNAVPFPDTVDFHTQYWLEVEVNGETMSPRERLVSAPYALYSSRALNVDNAVQSVFSSVDATRRRGSIMFAPYGDATLAESGDSIIIAIGGASGGGTAPNLTQVLASGRDAGSMRIENLGEPTARDHAATRGFVEDYVAGRDGLGLNFADSRFNVNVDGATIRIVNDTLMLAPGAITQYLIASGAVTASALAPNAVTASAIDWGSVMAVIRDSLQGAPAEGLTQYYTAGENINLRDAVFLNSNPYFVKIFTQASLPRSQMFNLMIPVELSSSFPWLHTTPDGRDIRILDSDRRTSLPYWFEVWDPASGKGRILVKTRYLNNGPDTLYIYYGDPSLGAMSNPDSTLYFGDHFDGSTLRSGWSASGTYYLSSSFVWLVSGSITRNYTLLDTFALSYYARITDSLSGSYVGGTINTQPVGIYGGPTGPGWARTYGGGSDDYGYSIIQTSDGGYLITGNSNSGQLSDGNWRLILIKLNSRGDTLWTKSCSGSSTEDYGYGLAQSSDGNYFVGGLTYDGSYYYQYLTKINNSGERVWGYRYTREGGYNEYGYNLENVGNDTLLLVGYSTNNTDCLVRKIKPDGSVSWASRYSGSYTEYAYGSAATTDGYVILGRTNGGGAGSWDYLAFKVDRSGNVQWSKYYGGSSYDHGFSITSSGDGGFILAGETYSYGVGDYDILLIKIDGSGNIIWAKTYGGSSGDYPEGYSNIKRTSDNGFIIAAHTYSFGGGNLDYLIFKINSTGDVQWARTYGWSSGEVPRGLALTTDGGAVVVGYTNSAGAGNFDIFVTKLGPSGMAVITIGLPYTGSPSLSVTSPAVSTGNYSLSKVSISTGSTSTGTLTARNPICYSYGVPLLCSTPRYITRYSSTWDTTGIVFTPDRYRRFTFRKLGGTLQYEIDDTVVKTITGLTQGITQFAFTGPNLYVDNVAFRKATLTDPAITVSDEQNPGQSIFKATALSQFAASSFLGIAVENASEGDTNVAVRVSGPVSGFGSLFPGATYYLSDVAGAISRAPGTISRVVGTAIDADVLNVNR